MELVSIHAPTRGATHSLSGICRLILCFNPRAHAGRDDIAVPTRMSANSCFNPRAHAGRDVAVGMPADRFRLFQSTRPRGARPRIRTSTTKLTKFQSTRPRGARPGRWQQLLRVVCFNPRAHAGRDQRCQLGQSCRSSFNPRAHAGRDLRKDHVADQPERFQSTRPRGARPFWASSALAEDTVSIHAPRGARP